MNNWFKKLFAEPTNCKLCKTAIQNGGTYVRFVGIGFCKSCAARIEQ